MAAIIAFRAIVTMNRLLGLACVLAATAATAVAQRYPFPLVPGSPLRVHALFQDSKSRLWLGAGDDLICFDGVHFYSMRAYGFPREYVRGMAEDGDGGIWAVTNDGEFRKGNGHGGVYRYWQGRVDKLAEGGSSSIVRIAPDVMLATRMESHGDAFEDIYRFRKEGGRWSNEELLPKAAWRLSVDHASTALFGCPDGWCEMSRDQIVDWPRHGTTVASHRLPSSLHVTTVALLRDQFGCVWIRSDSEAAVGCPGDREFFALPASLVQADDNLNLIESPQGQILMSLIADPAHLGLPAPMNRVRRFTHGDPTLLAADGTLWYGRTEGLRYTPYPFQMEYWTEGDGVKGGFSLLHSDGRVYMGTVGIQVLDAKRQRWNTLRGTEKLGFVTSMVPGPNGSIYASSLGRDVTQVNHAGKIVATAEGNNSGMSLAYDDRGQLWVGDRRRGIFRVETRGNSLLLQPAGLGDSTVLDMTFDTAHKTLWACQEQGIVARHENVWRRITRQDGLKADPCQSLAVDASSGDVWMAYNALPAFDLIQHASSADVSARKVVHFTSGGEIGDAKAMTLDVDSRGWLWRGALDANYVATPSAAAKGEWIRLDQQDGMPSVGSNQNASFADTDGSIWSNANDDIIHFSPPPGFATEFPAPKTFMAGFSANNAAPVLAEILSRFSPADDLTAHIGSLQFDRRHAIRLRWRLDERPWQITHDFSLHLGKPRWGGHLLQVQAQLSTGPWSPVIEQNFTVLLPVWLWWQAWLLYAAAGVSSAFGLAQWKKRQQYLRGLALPDMSAWRMEAMVPEAEQLIGTVVAGRYEIGHMLSIGGFSTVVRARDLRHEGRLCAVKIFRYELLDEAWVRHRFEHEVAALEALSHPNIVKITDHGTIDAGPPFLVMEFIHGRSLRAALEEGALPRRQIARYLRQLSGALEMLHRASIFHRDIKPENLMTRSNSDGGDDIVLIDFSIAMVKAPDKTIHGISRVAGTLGYMAPEQVTGYADASTDIHSLAKVVIEMLTGLRCAELLPEATLDLPEQITVYFMRHTDVLDPSSVAALASALAFDPARRTKDVSAFADPIIRNLDGAGGPDRYGAS